MPSVVTGRLPVGLRRGQQQAISPPQNTTAKSSVSEEPLTDTHRDWLHVVYDVILVIHGKRSSIPCAIVT